ncbi:hypothetical protein ACFLSJ_00690 [Verrucomicrobiota bacterium]
MRLSRRGTEYLKFVHWWLLPALFLIVFPHIRSTPVNLVLLAALTGMLAWLYATIKRVSQPSPA